MTKNDLIDVAIAATGCSREQARTTVDDIFTAITTEVARGGEVKVTGFGRFSRTFRKGIAGRNPRTGEAIEVAARNVAKFTPGKHLRERVAAA